MPRRKLLLVPVLVLMATACTRPVFECGDHRDCTFGQQCVRGTCVDACSADAQCPGGDRCVGGRCVVTFADSSSSSGAPASSTASSGISSSAANTSSVAGASTGGGSSLASSAFASASGASSGGAVASLSASSTAGSVAAVSSSSAAAASSSSASSTGGTTGVCDSLPNGTACTDTNACTVNTACENGLCVGTLRSCPAHLPHCRADIGCTCLDGNTCSVDGSPGTCSFGTCVTTYTLALAANEDDAFEDDDGSVATSNSDDSMRQVGDTAGYRFNGLRLVPGSRFEGVFLSLVSHDHDNNRVAREDWRAEASPAPPAFSANDNDLSARPVTSATVRWSGVIPVNDIGNSRSRGKSPDLSTLLQELLDRGLVGSNRTVCLLGRRFEDITARELLLVFRDSGAPGATLDVTLRGPATE